LFGEIRVGTNTTTLKGLTSPDAIFRRFGGALDKKGLATAETQSGQTSVASAPGLDYLIAANARSIHRAGMTRRFANHDTAQLIGPPATVNISGCINACGPSSRRPHWDFGVEKTARSFYQITIGGRADEKAAVRHLDRTLSTLRDRRRRVEGIVEDYLAWRAPR